jgi:hypothetical protein
MQLLLIMIVAGKMHFISVDRTLWRVIAINIRPIVGPRKKQLPVLWPLCHEQLQLLLHMIVVGKMHFFVDRTLRRAIAINISKIILNIIMAYSSRCTATTTA